MERISERYVMSRERGESFQQFIKRIGKAEVRKLVEDLARVPADREDRFYFSDWGDPREYSIDDIGVGECAGEVVSSIEFDLAAAEREVFEAQLLLERGDAQNAGQTAYTRWCMRQKRWLRPSTGTFETSAEGIVGRISQTLLRYREVFRSICWRQICPILVRCA